MGPGCAMLDYDGDGWQDLFLVNSRNLSGADDPVSHRPPTSALYRNNHDGTFTEEGLERGAVQVPERLRTAGRARPGGREDTLEGP